MALPALRLPSSDIDKRLERPNGWLERTCGVRYRHVVQDETQEGMAASAATSALQNAGLHIDDIELLLFGAAVGRQPIPATAPLIKKRLGGDGCSFPAYDINATCLSFVAALDQAALYINNGRANHVLVVSSEIASRALPWASAPATAGLFGDGAAAVVVSATNTTTPAWHLGSFHMETYSEGYDDCSLRAGGTRYDFHQNPQDFADNAFFEMNGRSVYRLSARQMPAFIDSLLEKAQWTHSEVDLIVPHQASPHALAHLSRRCGFTESQVYNIVADMGNQIAASIPIALCKAHSEGRLNTGMKVLLLGTSAGISLGGASLLI